MEARSTASAFSAFSSFEGTSEGNPAKDDIDLSPQIANTLEGNQVSFGNIADLDCEVFMNEDTHPNNHKDNYQDHNGNISNLSNEDIKDLSLRDNSNFEVFKNEPDLPKRKVELASQSRGFAWVGSTLALIDEFVPACSGFWKESRQGSEGMALS